jgi:hypothetical protein
MGGDVGVANPGVERVQFPLQHAIFDLEFQAATCADGLVVGRADLVRDADAQSHGHG